MQVRRATSTRSRDSGHGLAAHAFRISAHPTSDMRVRIRIACAAFKFDESWVELRAPGRRPHGRCAKLRDAPVCADEEYTACTTSTNDPGLSVALAVSTRKRISPRPTLPKACARRWQSFARRASTARWKRPRYSLVQALAARCAHDRPPVRAPLADEFKGLVACGGFSYGDVLGAGEGWAKSILFHEAVRERVPTASSAGRHVLRLGICNGCQMFAALKSLIPGHRTVAPLRAQPQRAVRGALSRSSRSSGRPRWCSTGWRGPSCRSRSRTARVRRSSLRRPPPRRAPRAVWWRAAM
jgi:phosphoribosylformylglycinamidine synthase